LTWEPSIIPRRENSQTSTKYFATADILEAAKDRSWLVKVTNTICHHWQKQNAKKKDPCVNGSRKGHDHAAETN
jgi:hypothetical protein